MPHLFTNRPRLLGLVAEKRDVRTQYFWEAVNGVVYKLGGGVFVGGSIMFFPVFEDHADVGAWAFFAGSLLYLLVSFHDLAEVIRYRNSEHKDGTDVRQEFLAVFSYIAGSALFAIGSLFFLSSIDLLFAGAWLFMIGSALFVVGACINVLQIVRVRSTETMQYKNLTAITFIVGSVLFLVASVPYLFAAERATTAHDLHSFVAWQYLGASLLFLMGAVFNYRRAWSVVRQAVEQQRRKDEKRHSGQDARHQDR